MAPDQRNARAGEVLPDAGDSSCGTSDADLSGRRAGVQHVGMSRAFVKEGEGAEGEPLAELQVSPHRNLVTAAGLAQIHANVERLRAELSAARESGDRGALQRVQRDLRYWSARQGTAELVPPPAPGGKARFGSVVRLEGSGGAPLTYRIVGEDEADPSAGRISYVSPIGRALIGRAAGDRVPLHAGVAEIVAVE
jgi:transcription elongation GreA/GreB family factor